MDLKFGFNVVGKPVEEYFDYASEHSLTHLEIDLIREHSFIETFDKERIDNLRKMSEKFKISLSLHTPYSINPSDRIPMIRNANIAYLRKCVSVARILHATHVTTHIGYCNGLPSWTWMRQRALERLVLSFEEVLKDCQEFEVKLALENVNPMPKDSEFFYLGDNLKDFEFLFSQLESPYINLCLDTGHANTSEGALAYIEKFGKKIINVHFHDNMGKFDDHLGVGEGTIPWKEVADAFIKTRFFGPFNSECFKSEPHEAKDALLRYFENQYLIGGMFR